jgi:hypothetical protein
MPSGKVPFVVRLGRLAPWLFFALVSAIALAGTRTLPGSWNDASRLATVEALVDYHTLAIDDSIFTTFTSDKIRVDGHFYSDKPPVPALWQAMLYAALQWSFGLSAPDHLHAFCFAMTFGSSGLAYFLAVTAIYRMGERLELTLAQTLLLAASFAFATLAPVYARYVNAHSLILATTSWLMLGLIPPRNSAPGLTVSWPHAVGLGMLAGMSYAIETGTGPILVLGTFCYLIWKRVSWKSLVVFALAAFPWFSLHHGICYAVGHCWRPLNTVPEYFQWDGSPFSSANLTGGWMHENPADCLRYGLELLFAERGFISHQPVLWLAGIAFGLLLCRRVPETPELCLACFWCVATWGLYTAASNNHAGLCCSVRWFLPLLAPAFYALAVAIRHQPRLAVDLAVVSLWGMLLAPLAWREGPWQPVNPWLLAGTQIGAVASWIVLVAWRLRQRPSSELSQSLAGPHEKKSYLPLTRPERRL